MIPGEIKTERGDRELNVGREQKSHRRKFR